MKNGDIVLRVDNLSKCFKIYSNPWYRAQEWMNFGKRRFHQPFWALQDISFKVRRGEFLGIIGQNGAGKSTLLKILSGVLEPTGGSYQVNGKILSMLELGMDFNPYLTGRENVIRSTELLGFPDGYVHKRMEQIVEFSELGEFFDRPVRLYSTGMSARLAFSLFAFLECDVLILDEVLAVGDLFFRQKCYARLKELIANDTTIVIVTHEMDVVQHYCNHVILLDNGREMYQGDPQEAIYRFYQIKTGWGPYVLNTRSEENIFEEMLCVNDETFWPPDEAFTPISVSDNGQPAQLIRLAVCNTHGKPCMNFTQGEQAYFYFEFHIKQDIGVPTITFFITNKFNLLIHGKSSLQQGINVPRQVRRGSYFRLSRSITLSIIPGEYALGIQLGAMHPEDYARLDDLSAEELVQRRVRLCRINKAGYFVVTPLGGEGLKGPHWGICDLKGDFQIQVVSDEKIISYKEQI